MIDRRSFNKGALASAAALGSAPFIARTLMSPTPALAQGQVPVSALKLPPLDRGKMVDGVRVFDLEMRRGMSTFFPGVQTPTLGINADFLGPVLHMSAGDQVRFNVLNNIGEPTTLHWHGLHLPAKHDGGPHQTIAPGQTWSPQFEIKQHAASFWYHSHLMHQTGAQVWRGLAGMMIVDDAHARSLNLPSTYGVDDIPLVLQDRSFNRDGTLAYSTSMHNTMMGNLGAILMVNGSINAAFQARTKLLRLRILNGSNARFWTVGFSDNRAFHQIATDGSLLAQPVRLTRLSLGPGERGEIVVDLSDGKPVALRNYPLPDSGGMMDGGGMMGGGRGMMGRMMRGRGGDMSVGEGADFLKIIPANAQTPSAGTPTRLPPKLLTLPRLNPADAARTRRFVLQMRMGPLVMMGISNPVSINGKVMDINRIDETIKLGDTEIWEISNRSPMPHPFHIHDIQFQILDRDGRPPAPNERGLKDTVVVNRGETVRVIAKFEDYADPDKPYMFHCHILEHEDAGMMGQFTVVA